MTAAVDMLVIPVDPDTQAFTLRRPVDANILRFLTETRGSVDSLVQRWEPSRPTRRDAEFFQATEHRVRNERAEATWNLMSTRTRAPLFGPIVVVGREGMGVLHDIPSALRVFAGHGFVTPPHVHDFSVEVPGPVRRRIVTMRCPVCGATISTPVPQPRQSLREGRAPDTTTEGEQP